MTENYSHVHNNLITNFTVINKDFINKIVTVGGFIHSKRDHGGLIFIDLRSENDLLQCVIDPTKNKDFFHLAETLSSESVVRLTGEVIAREIDKINPNLATGEVEVLIREIELIANCKPTPFDIHSEKYLANEDIRLKHRYLDFRRKKLKELLTAKHKLILATRNWFDSQDFIEVQTPILANSSPEGARDYLIPSRLHPGHFYALPQAPQQFKQLLMVGGFNKYFQIAPCFRDEDPRSDRHPGDFYQIDAEIAWAKQEDIFALNEKYANEVLVKFANNKIIPTGAFQRLTYDEAMDSYGSDKPDLRYNLGWKNAKSVFVNSGFGAFASLCESENSRIQALVIKGQVNNFSRSDLDKIQEIGRVNGLPGIAYIQFFEDGAKSPIFKFFGDEAVQEAKKIEIMQTLDCETGDLVLFVAHKDKNVIYKALNQIRQHTAKHIDKLQNGQFIDKNLLKFVWIYNFPFFEYDEATKKLDFTHNPFGAWESFEGMNKLETLKKAVSEDRLIDLRAIQYDLTLNGYELLSGGERNSDPETLMQAFLAIGYTEDEVRAKFKHMMEAYEFGAPSHAGFAWGLDRLFMILNDEDNIREVIAFPKNGQGIDPMTNSPMTVSSKQLKDLNIKIDN
jgi:aspartyl-tRNA synthetase